MGIEYELKFRATPEILDEIWERAVGVPGIFQMETTYYDTPTGALSARRYTLRHRKENDLSVCTLKMPAEEGGRKELEVFCKTIEEAIPKLCKLAEVEDLPTLLQDGVIPVCGAKFVRRAKKAYLKGATVELALDQGVLIGGGKEAPLCEMEVELKSGKREVMLLYATQLAVAYGMEQEKDSKFCRAQALAKGENHG